MTPPAPSPPRDSHSREVFGKGSIYTLGSIIQLSSAALVVPFITRLLSPEDYGVIALVLSVQVVFSGLVMLGMPAGASRLYFDRTTNDEPDVSKASTILVTSVRLSFAVSLTTALLVAIFGTVAGLSLLPLVIALVLTAPDSIQAVSLILLRVQGRAGAFVGVSVMRGPVSQAFGLLALVVGPETPVSYLVGYGIGVTLAAATGLVATELHRHGAASRSVLREALDVGLPTVPHNLSVFALALGDRIVIGLVGSAALVGQYQVSYALGGIGLTLLSSLQNAWAPITFGASEKERWSSLANTSADVIQVAALVAGSIALVAPVALEILAPASYSPSELVPVSGLIAAVAIPWAFYLPASQVLFWEKHTKPLAWITPSSAAVNLILVAVLTGPFGLTGAAVAMVVAILLQAALTMRIATRISTVAWEWARYLRIAAVGVLLVAAGIALPDDTPGLVVRGVLLAGAVIIGVRLLLRIVRMRPNGAAAGPAPAA